MGSVADCFSAGRKESILRSDTVTVMVSERPAGPVTVMVPVPAARGVTVTEGLALKPLAAALFSGSDRRNREVSELLQTKVISASSWLL